MAQDINRATAGYLPPDVAQEIWGKTVEDSAIMQLARRIELPGNGKQIPVITGEPEAAWVGETEEKPVSTHTLESKTITPYKLAVIEPVSEEFARDRRALYEELCRRLPKALATKFDRTVLNFDSMTPVSAPGNDFDQLGNATAITEADMWKALVTADGSVAAADGILNGWVFSPAGKSRLLSAVDNNNRPLYINNPAEYGIPTLLGAPVYVSKALSNSSPKAIAVAGDWSNAVYGTVEGIKIKTSTEASLNTTNGTLNLFQSNMIAVLAEIEVGFRVADINQFVYLDQKCGL